MPLDIGGFLKGAGQGLGIYAQYMLAQQEAQRDEKQQALENALRQSDLDLRRETLVQDRTQGQRRAFDEQADQELDRLARAGVYPGQDFRQHFKASQLPEVAQAPGDVASLVLNALRKAGQEKTAPYYSEAPGALNQLMNDPKLERLAQPLPSGGFAAMEPGVLGSLRYAKTNAEIAAANRAHERAMQREKFEHETKEGTDPVLERQRLDYVTERAGELMKPTMFGPRTVAPGVSAAEAYRRAREEWELARAGTATQVPSDRQSGRTGPLGEGLVGRAASVLEQGAIAATDPATAYDELRAKGLDHGTAVQLVNEKFGLVQ